MKRSVIINSDSLPEYIRREVAELGKKHNINRIILFGSRARGNNRRASDVDLAVSGGNVAAFSADLEEEIATLLKFDVVDLGGKVQAELLNEIEKEKLLLYEKNG